MTNQELNEQVARKLASHGNAMVVDENTVFKLATSEVLYNVKDYCNSIQAAWEIVEFLHKQKRCVELSGELEGHWNFGIYRVPYSNCLATAKADTAPLAIVRAFLKLP